MAKEAKEVKDGPVNRRGEPIKEYPKLVKTEGGKVLVKSKKEEDALGDKAKKAW